MTQFHHVRFPLDLSFGSSGGPERRTDIVTLTSGHEERNTLWRTSRRRYNAGYGVRSLDDIHRIIHFFEARKGRLHGFLWRDPMDWKSCLPSETIAVGDQTIGIGDGTMSTFQLVKTYQSGGFSWKREITKAILESVVIAVNEVAQNKDSDYTIEQNGTISFLEQAVPAQGHKITAGFKFDVPVRFDTDYLEIDLEAFQAGQIPEIPLIEIKS